MQCNFWTQSRKAKGHRWQISRAKDRREKLPAGFPARGQTNQCSLNDFEKKESKKNHQMHTDHLRSRIIHLTAATIYVPQVLVLRPHQSSISLPSRITMPSSAAENKFRPLASSRCTCVWGRRYTWYRVGTADIRSPGGVDVVLVLCWLIGLIRMRMTVSSNGVLKLFKCQEATFVDRQAGRGNSPIE